MSCTAPPGKKIKLHNLSLLPSKLDSEESTLLVNPNITTNPELEMASQPQEFLEINFSYKPSILPLEVKIPIKYHTIPKTI